MLFYSCLFVFLIFFKCILILGFVIVFMSVFIYNYCIICENLPNIERLMVVRAIVVFYNELIYGTTFRKVISKTTRKRSGCVASVRIIFVCRETLLKWT